MSEIVFILGAGASKEAGAPVMAEFLDKADELRRGQKLGEFQEHFDRVFEAIWALQQVHSKSQLDLDNLESVFGAFEMGRLTKKLPGFQPEDIEPVLQSIRRMMVRTLEMTMKYRIENGTVHPFSNYLALAKLIEDLSRVGRSDRCSIITLNYDIAIDHALDCMHRPPQYYVAGVSPHGATTLLKLHGSLNWARCSKCAAIIPWAISSFMHQIRPSLMMSEAKGGFLNVGTLLSSSGLTHCDQDVGPDPVIVPPTWNKTEYHRTLASVWERAAFELSESENIFVIGYSLTETDSFFRYLYALGSVGRPRIKRFWVFNPDEHTVRPRFEKLIGSGIANRFVFHPIVFSDAVRAIRRELIPKK